MLNVYLFFGLFMANAVIAFSLRRGKAIALATLIGTVLNAVISMYLSSVFEWWYAVFGLVISSAIMALATTIYIAVLARNADYVYFSAF